MKVELIVTHDWKEVVYKIPIKAVESYLKHTVRLMLQEIEKHAHYDKHTITLNSEMSWKKTRVEDIPENKLE